MQYPDDDSLMCENCSANMKLLTFDDDEGEYTICWCPECGTIWEGNIGEEGDWTKPNKI